MSRIRTNLITNRMANGAPTVSHGLVISGVTTVTGSINNLNLTGITTITTLDLNGDLDVDGHLNADNVSIAGVVTATSFVGSGANLTGISQVGGASTVGFDDNKPIYFGDNNDYKVYFNNSKMFFEPTHSGTQQFEMVSNNQMYIKSKASGLFLVSGNQNVIDIYGGSGGGVYFKWNNSQKLKLEGGNWTYLNGATVTHAGDVSIPDSIIHVGDTNTKIRFPADDTFTVETAGSERLRIASGGAVMINTTNSSSRTLNLNGTFGILSTNQSGVIDMSVTDAGVASIGPYVAGGSTLVLKTNASGSGVAERLRITSDGNVNINSSGLSSPYSSFRHISINNNLILNAQNNAGGFAGMQNNAYLNSSGAWVRVNNDHATSIGTDDGNFYFRNAGAGTGTISWNNVLNIDATGRITQNGTTSADTASALTLKNGQSGNDHTILELISDPNQYSLIYFGASDDRYKGQIRYKDNDHFMDFRVNGTDRFRIASDGKLYKDGNHFYPLVNYSQYASFTAVSTSSNNWTDLRTILSGYTPKKAGNIIVIHHQSQMWQGGAANSSGDAMWRIQKQEGGGSWSDVIENARIMGNMDGQNYTGNSGLARHHRTVHLMGSFECAGTTINLKSQGKVDFTSVGLQWYHHNNNILQVWEYEKG